MKQARAMTRQKDVRKRGSKYDTLLTQEQHNFFVKFNGNSTAKEMKDMLKDVFGLELTVSEIREYRKYYGLKVDFVGCPKQFDNEIATNGMSGRHQLFSEYFNDWVELYKAGDVSEVTLNKYRVTQKQIELLAPQLTVGELDKRTYQKLINAYAETHEKQTTQDFHTQLKASILDALDERLIDYDPTRKVVIKGKEPTKKRKKFLNHGEVQALLRELDLNSELNWDWFILLVTKTGIRFAEALGLTPADFDFKERTLTINKTWNYKSTSGGFKSTKNDSSVRKISIDWELSMQFQQLLKDKEVDKPIFVKQKRVFNSTINQRLQYLCRKANIPEISIHGLRHTHASLLLFAEVTTASVARRLGHASTATTQETYMHIIKELEEKDNTKTMQYIASLTA